MSLYEQSPGPIVHSRSRRIDNSNLPVLRAGMPGNGQPAVRLVIKPEVREQQIDRLTVVQERHCLDQIARSEGLVAKLLDNALCEDADLLLVLDYHYARQPMPPESVPSNSQWLQKVAGASRAR